MSERSERIIRHSSLRERLLLAEREEAA